MLKNEILEKGMGIESQIKLCKQVRDQKLWKKVEDGTHWLLVAVEQKLIPKHLLSLF